MSLTDAEDDPSFVTLSPRLRRRIDDAFDSVVSQPRTEPSAQGFIVEESRSATEAGGFIVEDLGAQSHIPLSEISRALNLLDVIPDDELLEVFKNAATGWGAQNPCHDGVSRKDWRAICTAVLEGDGSDEENVEDSDEYLMEDEETGDDEYAEPTSTGKPQHLTRTTAKRSVALTDSQRAQCRQDFRRFFPQVADEELDEQRITVKDITRVADVLKENLTTEQIMDMLEAFSTSPDKSINLADFEQMMILTKLIQSR